MMRWPWTRRLPDPETRERDRDQLRAAEFRHKAEQLTDELQALADRLEQRLDDYERNGRPRPRG